MKKLIIGALLTSSLMVSGCLTTYWTHPVKPISEFDKDKYECQGIAQQRAYYEGGVRYSSNILIVKKETQRCLRIKGWVSE